MKALIVLALAIVATQAIPPPALNTPIGLNRFNPTLGVPMPGLGVPMTGLNMMAPYGIGVPAFNNPIGLGVPPVMGAPIPGLGVPPVMGTPRLGVPPVGLGIPPRY